MNHDACAAGSEFAGGGALLLQQMQDTILLGRVLAEALRRVAPRLAHEVPHVRDGVRRPGVVGYGKHPNPNLACVVPWTDVGSSIRRGARPPEDLRPVLVLVRPLLLL